MKKLYLSKEWFTNDISGQSYGKPYFFYSLDGMDHWVEIDPNEIEGFVDENKEIGSDDPVVSVSFEGEKYQLIYQIG